MKMKQKRVTVPGSECKCQQGMWGDDLQLLAGLDLGRNSVSPRLKAMLGKHYASVTSVHCLFPFKKSFCSVLFYR